MSENTVQMPVIESPQNMFVYAEKVAPEGIVSGLNEHHIWVGSGVPHLLVAGVWTKIKTEVK
jgi:hypothetical protein